MNGSAKSNYPHLALHLVTVLIALAALALAMLNYREIKMVREHLRASARTGSAAVHEKTAAGVVKNPAPGKGRDSGKTGKRALKRRAESDPPEKKSGAGAEDAAPGIRDRGLNEIISDLVDSVFE